MYFYIWAKNILKLNEHQYHHSKWTITVSNFLWYLRIISIETSQLMKGNRILYQSQGRLKHKYGNVVILSINGVFLSINGAFLRLSICVQEYFFLSKLWKCHRFWEFAQTQMSLYMYICVCVCVRMCVCVCVRMYVCVYVCMYVCV
jgi:hypothetical protein